jgi:hypothetical protein
MQLIFKCVLWYSARLTDLNVHSDLLQIQLHHEYITTYIAVFFYLFQYTPYWQIIQVKVPQPSGRPVCGSLPYTPSYVYVLFFVRWSFSNKAINCIQASSKEELNLKLYKLKLNSATYLEYTINNRFNKKISGNFVDKRTGRETKTQTLPLYYAFILFTSCKKV